MPNLLASITSTTSDTAPASFADVKDLVATVTVDSVNSIILLIAHLPIDIATGTDNQPDAQFAVGGVREGPLLALGVEDAVDEGHGGMMIYALTGLSGSQTFSLQWQQLLAGSCLTDGSRARSFQVIELLDGEANILVNASSVASDTAPATYANIVGMSGVASVASADSVLLMTLNMVLKDRGSSNGADFQFAIDGTREGAETSPTIDDNGGKASAGAFTHAKTGISGSKTFSCQWQLRHGSNADADDTRERRFQVIEFLNADLLADIQNTTGGTAPATYADVPGFSAAVTVGAVSSIVMIGANVAIESTGGDQTADGQFADGGTREGPEMTFTYVDDTGGHLVSSGMVWSKTGVSGSKTFSFQWQDRLLAPQKETARTSTFWVIELKTTAADFIDPIAILSAEAFGELTVEMFLNPDSIGSGEAFGTPRVVCTIGGIAGIPSAEAFGNLTIVAIISPTSVPSGEAFGTPKVNFSILPASIVTAETFGTPVLKMTINVDSVPSAEAFGTLVMEAIINITPFAIPSEEVVSPIFAMVSGRPPIQTPIRTGRPWWFDHVIGRRG